MDKNIGNILRNKRIEAGMSVKDISLHLTAKGYKASEKTIYSWENGNSQPSPDALLEMCDAYKIDDILQAFGYDGYKKDGALQPSLNELNLLEKYRKLDDTGRQHVDTVLDWEAARSTAAESLTSQVTELTGQIDSLRHFQDHHRFITYY